MEFQYNENQKKIIENARKSGMEHEKLRYIENPRLSAEQMDCIFACFQDGLPIKQVKEIASPDHSVLKMNQLRNEYKSELENQLDPTRNNLIRNPERNTSSMEYKINEYRMSITRELNQHGFQSSTRLVKQIEDFNHLTGRNNTIRDIHNAYKNKTFENQPHIQKSLDDITNSLRAQELHIIPNMER